MKWYQWFIAWPGRGLQVIVWLLVSAACPTSALALTQGELDANRNLWNMSGSDGYNYFMQRSCFCAREFIRPGLVEVRVGAITAVTDAETLQPLDPQFFLTVDGLFGELQDAIDFPAFDIQAEFDSNFGYPTSISIDFLENAVDDVVIYAARGLHVIPESGSLALAFLGTMGIVGRIGRQRRTR